jgi:ABC-type uncharacterized transport system substrate-binding protein
MDLLKLALPGRHRIGVLIGPESRMFETEMQRSAADRGLEAVIVRSGGEDLGTAMQRVIDEAEVLLAVPDPKVFNGSTIQNILTSAYRRRIPLVGFSPAYVKAGALLAIYSSPTQVGLQAGEAARGFLAGRGLPPPQGPHYFSVGINPDVAHSLGIVFDADATTRLAEQLHIKERGQ